MAYSFTEKKRIRKSFAKRDTVLPVPFLLATQLDSYAAFLQASVPPENRATEGLQAAFHEVQFLAEVRRTHPLSLKLTRQGGSRIVDGLVWALRALRTEPGIANRVA